MASVLFSSLHLVADVTAIIVSSHYSILASKLCGNNAVQVLATLFLLTYAKIVRLVIDVVSFTTLTYPDGHTKTVLAL